MTDIRVSVILACHDAEETLSATLHNLAQSDFADFEVIVVDDASRDHSRDVARVGLESFAVSRLIELDANVGVARARNIALGQAKGQFVWFVDADDIIPPTALREMFDAAIRFEADVVFARATETDVALSRVIAIDGLEISEATPLSVDEVFAAVATGAIRGFLWSKLFRRSVLPAELFPSMRSQSDFMGLMAVLDNAREFVAIPNFVYDYVRRAGSITTRQEAFSTLLQCERAFLSVAAGRGVTVSASDEAYFSGVLTLLAGLNSALRTGGWAALDRRLIRRELRRVRLLSIVGMMRSHPRTGMLLALARTSLVGYSTLYGVGRAARGVVLSRRERSTSLSVVS